MIRNEVVVEKSMPPSGDLADSDRQLVAQWLDAGSPENDVETVEPSPTPVASPSPAPSPSISPTPDPSVQPTTLPTVTPTITPSVTYATVRDQVFTPYCVRCHSSNLSHPSGGVKLDTYASVISYLSRVENELLVDQSMPPSGPLSTTNQNLFRTWVNEGTPQ